MHLINDDVGWLYLRTLILLPSLRICLVPIDHGTTHSVDSHRLRSDSGSLFEPLSIPLYLEGIECSLYIFLHGSLPETILGLLHIDDLESSIVRSSMVESELCCLCIRRPDREFRKVSLIYTFFKHCLRYSYRTVCRT